MDRVHQTRFLTRRSWPLLVGVLLLHVLLLTLALVNKSYLTDDSIQYLTLSENLIQEGVWSQSYTSPWVPDIQRTPGYPVFLALAGNCIPIVLILQHLMVLFGGWVLFRILSLWFSPRIARWGAWAWLIQPYPVLMASLVLSEVSFILVMLLGVWGILMFRKQMAWKSLLLGGLALALAAYIRPVAMPMMIVLLLLASGWAVFKKSKPVYALSILLVPLLLGPWMMRNQAVSGKLTFNSMGDMALIHGRLGGLEAFRTGKGVGEAGLFQLGDSLFVQEAGMQGYRSYYTKKESHETELYRAGAMPLTMAYFLKHPVDGFAFQLKSWWNMAKGLGYGWSQQLTGHSRIATGLAIVQGLLNLLMFAGVLLAIWNWRHWPPGMSWVMLSIGIILLISGAAWADGRYRMVVDPLLILMGGVGGMKLFGGIEVPSNSQ